jgi:chromosome segregation ATPase
MAGKWDGIGRSDSMKATFYSDAMSIFFGKEDILSALTRIERKIDLLTTTLNQESKQMAKLDDDIAALQAEVAQETSVTESAIALLDGIPKMIADAVAAAQAAGATPEQLAAIEALSTSLQTQTTNLAAAVAANTPQG